ncbi:winged helix-turn-helix transcriptional regulator [Halobacteriaceae archaeon SHR40]|uniref:winged helix-turn-helix transcriptional regulator n=1 Tax=Halovenus amylolytica TaxID=2500550 RepID=UPI000FE39099
MSEPTGHGNRMQESATPRAMVHKKILDAAKNHPDSSIEGLADRIGGATIQLVERVLDEYGDPAESESSEITEQIVSDHQLGEKSADAMDETMSNEQTNGTEPSTEPATNSTTPTGDASQSIQRATEAADTTTETAVRESTGDQTEGGTGQSQPQGSSTIHSDQTETLHQDPENLTEKRLEVLRAIHNRPHATQAELADQLEVSRATISQRVNAIEGFEWADRQEYIDAIFDGNGPISDGMGVSQEELAARINSLTDRIEQLEETIGELSESRSTAFDDPELAATVVRACLDSDTVTEQQEQEIIVEMIEAGRYSA